ncbi:MAG: hemerythrin family protein [Alphaproteobacteria bacterium]|nr:hemerythrin family protein [Alphaproteobacteria bacterium]
MKNLQFFVPRAGKINITDIDDDHIHIVAALDEVRQNMDNPEYRTIAKAREVATLLLKHFKDEERLMSDYKYPRLHQHMVHHDQALGNVFRILGACEMREEVNIEDLRDIFRIMIDDIFSADMAFSNYVLESKRHCSTN